LKNFRDIEQNIINDILSKEHWASHPKANDWFEFLLNQKKTHTQHYLAQLTSLLALNHWHKKPNYAKWVNSLLYEHQAYNPIMEHIMSTEYGSHHNLSEKWFIDSFNGIINTYRDFTYFFTAILTGHWKDYHNRKEMVQKIINFPGKPNETEQNSLWLNLMARLAENKHLDNTKGTELIKFLIDNNTALEPIVTYVFEKEFWANEEAGGLDLLKKIVNKAFANKNMEHKYSSIIQNIVTKILTKDNWMKHPHIEDLLQLIINLEINSDNETRKNNKNYSANSIPKIIEHLFTLPFWQQHPKNLEWLQMFVSKNDSSINSAISRYIFNSNYWVEYHYEYLEKLIDSFVRDQAFSHENIVEYALTKGLPWIKHEKVLEWIKIIANHPYSTGGSKLISKILVDQKWVEHPASNELIWSLVKHNKNHLNLAKILLSQPRWINHELSGPILEQIILNWKPNFINKNKEAYIDIGEKLFTMKEWLHHPDGLKLLALYLKPFKKYKLFKHKISKTTLFANNSIWQNHPLLKQALNGKKFTFNNIITLVENGQLTFPTYDKIRIESDFSTKEAKDIVKETLKDC
jgi:hypothetical protein